MIKNVAYFLINPMTWLLIFAILYVVFKRINKVKLSNIALFLFVVWLFIIYISPIPQYLIYKLEYQYPVLNVKQVADIDSANVLVLGGGSSVSPDLPANSQLTNSALSRLVEGIRLYYLINGSNLVLSGYSASDNISVAELMALTAIDLGVSEKDTLMNIRAANTELEALHYLKRFGKDKQLVLVTSARHMPRAMAHFTKLGSNPIAAPTNYYIRMEPHKRAFNFYPSVLKIILMEQALKEYVAIAKLLLTT